MTKTRSFTTEDILALTLPQTRGVLTKAQDFSTECLVELESGYKALMDKGPRVTAVEVSGYIARAHYLVGNLMMRKAMLQRYTFYVRQDYRDKFREKIKFGPRGSQSANNFAWAEREAAAESTYLVEKTKLDLFQEAVDENDRAVAAADSFIWGAKALQARLKQDHEEARFASNKHYTDETSE